MGMYVCPSGRVAHITHRMADGSIRDSVEGYEVPYNENTANIYRILANMVIHAAEREQQKESEGK